MKIIVCIKQVPDVEANFYFKPDNTGVEVEKMAMIINPGDEVAIEGALRLKAIYPDTEVILVSLGPSPSREGLEYGLSMGADKAVHIQDSDYVFGQPFRTAHILSKAIQEIGFDMILFGYKAVDDRLHFVGPAVAEFLNLPHITGVTFIKLFPGIKRCEAHQEVPKGINIIDCLYPAVFTVKRGLMEPRYPSLVERLAAQKKEITSQSVKKYWNEESAKQFPRHTSMRFSISEGMAAERKVKWVTPDEIANFLGKYKTRKPDSTIDAGSGEEL